MMMMENPHQQGTEEIPANGDYGRYQRNQGTVLFVGNLPFQTPWQNVKDHFRNAGKVRYTDLIADRNGRPKGSALVTMMTPEGADNAIRMFNETDFEGRRLIVRKFDDGPRPPLVQRDMMPPYNSSANTQRRAQYTVGPTNGATGFYPANPNGANGAYTRTNYGRPATGASYHAGEMEDPNGVNLNDLGPEQVPKPRSQQVSEVGRKLFVSNLPFDCTGSALRETFQQVGNVERAEIILGRNGRSRGMGIIVMSTAEEAHLAISEFDKIEMANRAMNVRLDSKAQ